MTDCGSLHRTLIKPNLIKPNFKPNLIKPKYTRLLIPHSHHVPEIWEVANIGGIS